jgi:hypothetical protein
MKDPTSGVRRILTDIVSSEINNKFKCPTLLIILLEKNKNGISDNPIKEIAIPETAVG